MTPRMRDILKSYNDIKENKKETKKESIHKEKGSDIVFGNLKELKDKLLNKKSEDLEDKVKSDNPEREKFDNKKENNTNKEKEEKKDEYTNIFGTYESLKEKLLKSSEKAEEKAETKRSIKDTEKKEDEEESIEPKKPDNKINGEIQKEEALEERDESISPKEKEIELELSGFNEIKEEILKTPKKVIHETIEEIKKEKPEETKKEKVTDKIGGEPSEAMVQKKIEPETQAAIEGQVSGIEKTIGDQGKIQEEYEFSNLESIMENLKKPHIPPPISEERPSITKEPPKEKKEETPVESIKKREIEKSEEVEEKRDSPYNELEKEIEKVSPKEEYIKRVPDKEPQITAETLEYSGIDFYIEAHKVVEQMINQINTKSHELIIPVLRLVPTFVNNVLHHEELLALAIQKKRYSKWLVSHQVNVAIISLKIGIGLNLPENKLSELAVSALLHDIGMLKIPNSLIFKHGRLTEDEFNLIKKHPEFGVELVSQLKSDYHYLIEAIYQEHERYDGYGYPRGLRGNEISMYPRIIGLADTLEALLHGRAYRDGFITQKAIQTIIQQRAKSFDPKILRVMIDTISIFPVGSYVKLNTGELARVISINKQRPVRPTVEVIKDKNGENISKPYQIDLEKEPLIYIIKQIS